MPYKAKNSCFLVKIQKAFCKKLSKFVAKRQTPYKVKVQASHTPFVAQDSPRK